MNLKKILAFIFILLVTVIIFLSLKSSSVKLFVHSVYNLIKVSFYTEDLVFQNTFRGNSTYDDISFTWDTERERHTWKYYNGLFMKSLLMNNSHKSYADRFYDDNITDSGNINNTRNPRNYYREGTLDDVVPARTLFYLLDSPNANKYKLCLSLIRHKLDKQPLLKNVGNNYVHKINNRSWVIFPFGLDGLLVLPYILEYDKYVLHTENKDDYDEVFRRMDWVAKNLKNEVGLYNHGIKSDGKTVNGYVWLRGVGWYAMSQIDILNLFPEGKQKNILKAQLKDFLDSMIKYQDKKTGMWYNIVYPQTSVECNFLESSGSAMMAYTLMEAYLKDYVTDKSYAIAGLKAFNGVVDNHLIKQGLFRYKLINTYKSSIVYDKPDSYCICSNYVENEAKGVAPLIMASSLVNKTLQKLLSH